MWSVKPTSHFLISQAAPRDASSNRGTNTFDRWEMRIHKRLIDLHSPSDVGTPNVFSGENGMFGFMKLILGISTEFKTQQKFGQAVSRFSWNQRDGIMLTFEHLRASQFHNQYSPHSVSTHCVSISAICSYRWWSRSHPSPLSWVILGNIGPDWVQSFKPKGFPQCYPQEIRPRKVVLG